MKGGRSKSTKADNMLAVRTKKAKDPNKPKRPSSAFFVFMDEFRKQFKEKNPNYKIVSIVSKAGGDKWKTMSDAEKAPFVAKAEKLKAEYLKNVAAYDRGEFKNGVKNAEGEDSDKSKSKVNDEEADEA